MKNFEVTLHYSNPEKKAVIYVPASEPGEAASKAKKIALEQFEELKTCQFENWLAMELPFPGDNKVFE
ncbi:MAG: hypothetical protein ACOY4W_15435 [Thermodesulfobacteriota bacterium]